MSTAVSVRMPDELVRDLDSVAKTTERSRSFHIQKALEIYLEDILSNNSFCFNIKKGVIFFG